MKYLAALFLLSAFSLNLPLQTGLGVRALRDDLGRSVKNSFFECAVLFISIYIQYALFTFAFSPLNLVFFKYFMIFPLSAVFPALMQIFHSKVILKYMPDNKCGDYVFDFSYKTGLSIAAVLLVLYIAGSPQEALVLDLGFCFGIFCTALVLKAVSLRLVQERTSALFRGLPLMLISMGLLAMIWTQVIYIYLIQRGRF